MEIQRYVSPESVSGEKNGKVLGTFHDFVDILTKYCSSV